MAREKNSPLVSTWSGLTSGEFFQGKEIAFYKSLPHGFTYKMPISVHLFSGNTVAQSCTWWFLLFLWIFFFSPLDMIRDEGQAHFFTRQERNARETD